ncbi:hypothetical protein EsDP_00004083 [Epichloe bromicola]|uniref:O-acyltransferase n=1 Tax=Epichloe bromicola TaxID=79588 RepID=A0ABQ0CQP6_9HYPO
MNGTLTTTAASETHQEQERPIHAPPSSGAMTSNHDAGSAPDHRPRGQPRSLGEALREAGISLESTGPGSDTPSEEDYDENVRPNYMHEGQSKNQGKFERYNDKSQQQQEHGHKQEQSLRNRNLFKVNNEMLSQLDTSPVRDGSGIRVHAENNRTLQELLAKSSKSSKNPEKAVKQRRKFRDYLFTHQFSAFDPHNLAAANSPFHGFYTLFWLAVALFMLKISVKNWMMYGTPFGSNEIMKTMFHRDVIVLLLSDGIMCGLTAVWQVVFIASVIFWTHVRDWPWTHTIFFVLHGLVMLMKQHSYAFSNGYLSTVYEKRLFLLSKLKQLEKVPPSDSPSSSVPTVSSLSTSHLRVPPSAMQRRHSLSQVPSSEEPDIEKIAKAIASHKPLNDEQIRVFERIIKWEVDALADELRGTASDAKKAYPNNLTFSGHYQWIPLPTLVYELEYPRTESISWPYVAEKLVAMVGVLFVMNQVAQYSIWASSHECMKLKLTSLMLVWYLIWETILNVLAELTHFADRSFYDAWWNSGTYRSSIASPLLPRFQDCCLVPGLQSILTRPIVVLVSWDQFARDWNRPVHVFLLRHVYHSSISSMKVKKHTATLITFFLSACIHELVMWCLFKKLRGYLLVLQMCQLPVCATLS